MIERVKILAKLQLTNKTGKHATSSLRKYRDIALKIISFIITTGIIGLALHLIKNILYIPVNVYFLIFMLLLTQVLSIIAAVSGLMIDIYQSKDNQILFTMPAKNDEIYLSKLVVYYIGEYKKSFYFLLPFLVAYGYITGLGILYFIALIPLTFVLPFIVVFFSSILSVIIIVIKNYMQRHPWVNFGLSISLIVASFILVYYLVGFIPENIRIVQLYNSFIAGLTRFMQNVANFGIIYTVIGKLLIGQNILVNILIILGNIIALFLLNVLVGRPLFFSLTSKTSEHARKKKHNPKVAKRKGLFWTFFRKESTIARRSPNEMLSNYGVLVALPIVMYVLNSIYMGMDRSSLGNNLVLIFNILIVLILITASNTASAVSITTEGFEFVLLKTAPSKTKQVAWAKMAFNFIFTSVLLLISFILFRIALPVFNPVDVWCLFIFSFLFNASQIFWSFQLDIISPKLAEYASTGSLSNNENVKKTLSNGLIVSLVFTFISIFVFVLYNSVAWIILIIVGILWLVFRFVQFKSYLDAYFVDIEY